jgi:hypothetical protein
MAIAITPPSLPQPPSPKSSTRIAHVLMMSQTVVVLLNGAKLFVEHEIKNDEYSPHDAATPDRQILRHPFPQPPDPTTGSNQAHVVVVIRLRPRSILRICTGSHVRRRVLVLVLCMQLAIRR